MQKKPTYISLFSGAGIGCYGFKLNNFECVITNELIERRLNIQKFNDKCKYSTGYICGDVTEEKIKQKIESEIDYWENIEHIDDIDVVIATPPCQGMSVANHKKKKDEIIRNSLVVEAIKIIEQISPKFFIFENVPAFMKTACTDTNGEIISIKEAINNHLGSTYSMYSKVINFKDYGACSSRSRTILIAVRNDLANQISPIELFPDYCGEQKLHQVIGSMRRLTVFGEIDPDDIFHAFRTYPKHMRSWISNLKEGQSAFENDNILDKPHRVIDGKIILNKQKNGDKYRRQFWDKVGPCIHTRNDQLASQNTIHPSDDRVFSIRELMKMLTIPKEFKWSFQTNDELNAMSIEQKRKFLKKEEMNIRQSLGESVPTFIFSNIAEKINVFLGEHHLSVKEVKQEINQNDLFDTDKLLQYISNNPQNISVNSLALIAEYANKKRASNAAFFTDKSLITDILQLIPEYKQKTVYILEPSVGVGNFIPLLIKRYQYIEELVIDVVDIDKNVLSILKILLKKLDMQKHVRINYLNSDFLLLDINKKYDLVIGNPPFNKLSSSNINLKQYRKEAYNSKTTNIFSFFLEKALNIAKNVALIAPKNLLNTPEFELSRELLSKKNISSIIDFGEKGFKGVLIETMAIIINTVSKPSKTLILSKTQQLFCLQRQNYIVNKQYPYWLIYRNEFFDNISKNMKFDIFTVFRDRQITNRMLSSSNEIRVIKSRNISDDGSKLLSIPNYDAYISKEDAVDLSVYKFLNRNDVYLSPNMTYKPRMMRKPIGMLVNGSVAILILKNNEPPLSEEELLFYSTKSFRDFYRIARNYQTRSLNIDTSSVFFFGRLRNEDEMNEVVN